MLTVEPCDHDPCQNGGKCEVVGAGYKCSCINHYSGRDCQGNNNNGLLKLFRSYKTEIQSSYHYLQYIQPKFMFTMKMIKIGYKGEGLLKC